MDLAMPQLQRQQEDLPEKIQPPYEGRWVLGPDGENMVYVVSELPPIPRFVIPLPAPPSDCGSAYQSDSSLTASIYPADPNFRSNTFDDIDRSAHSQIVDSDKEDDEDEADTEKTKKEVTFLSVNIDKTTTSFGSGQKSKRSNGSTAVETECFTDDLEGQRYPQSIFQHGNKNKKDIQKKKVTVVEPAKSWSEERFEENLRLQEEIRKTKKREICCRKAVYVLIFLSFLAIVIGGGLSAMVYYDVIDLGNINLNFDFLRRNTTKSDKEQDGVFETPLPTFSPNLDNLKPTSKPTALPTVFDATNERTFITDTLSGQFRISLPENDPYAPSNRAVNWMARELKSVGDGNFEYKYDNLGKFAQRFALLSTQFSLLGDDVDIEPRRFFFDKQMGVDECEWEGVRCDAYGRVIELDFSDLELTGRIASEIHYLFKLETLDLSNNGITGSIPSHIYDLRNLKKLYLYRNELMGTISTLIGNLDSLEYLHLSSNLLSGSIPNELQSYSYSVLNPLKYLNFYDNQLTGTIPNNLKLGNLFYFDVGRNFISGSIPSDIGEDYSELKFLHIDHNRLTSSIPESIPLMANGRMISLFANNNRLSGSVPDNWIMFNKLVQYNIHENYFDYLGPKNCKMNVFTGGNCVEFKADCDICTCDNKFCSAMC